MITEFELPDELKDVTYEKILSEMLSRIPNEYDKLEGSFTHDLIAPSALEAAELIQFWLTLGLRTNFHMWASGIWLDRHAADCGLTRKAATHAYTTLEVRTSKAVTFPINFIFSVPAEGSEPAIDFATVEEISCPGAGLYTFEVKAVEPGKASNVAANTISIMKNPVKGVVSIENPEAVTGGTEPESDESLRRRIDDFYAGHGASYVGNKKDYIRWAREVDGVGYVQCIPNYDGENSVKLIVADENGDPANAQKLQSVSDYIFGKSPDDLDRLAPIGVAKFAVVAPSAQKITLNMEAKLSASASLVKKNMVNSLTAYFKTLADDDNIFGELKYQKVAAILSGVVGLEDFRNLKIGIKESSSGTQNISFTSEQIPQIEVGNISLSEWLE